ncbi:Surfeit locus protein 6-like protein, partial [Stegodyphus mimosarum]
MEQNKRKYETSVVVTENGLPDVDYQKLIERITEEDKFLRKLVDTIPAKLYFDQEIQNKISIEKEMTMNKVAEDLKRKFSHYDPSNKLKQKRARFDPTYQKSVSQIQEQCNKQNRKKNRKTKDIINSSSVLARAANIEELQKRLQERIDQLQLRRKSCNPSDTAEKEKIKKKLKKMKSKQKINLTKNININNKVQSPEVKEEKSEIKPVFNKDSNIMYSKLDFTEDGHEEKNKDFMIKKPKLLLKEAEKKKEKLEHLLATDPEKAKIAIEKDKWKKAIQRTEGMKVKDDPSLLKKSIKKEMKKKKKSSKAWKERTEQVETLKKTRQEKRLKNIKARKREKLEHKIKRAKKK